MTINALSNRCPTPSGSGRARAKANNHNGFAKIWLARGSPHTCWPCTGPPD